LHNFRFQTKKGKIKKQWLAKKLLIVFCWNKFNKNHDADTNEMLKKIGVSDEDIMVYLTDNGSNMIKAYKNDFEGYFL